jgi:cyclopropane fatty-acyl-phospholipid synthase-like methyltransferase
MALDLVHSSQLAIRRAGQLLRRRGVLPQERQRHEILKGEALDRFFEFGERQVQSIDAELQAHAGAGIAGRRGLDFGCGMGRTTLAMASRCELVYGLDVAPVQLEEAARNAHERGVTNVVWMDSGRLRELAGEYDLVISYWVFQHIPSREGERIFAQILAGLQPGGIGAVHFVLRTESPARMAARADIPSAYMSMNSYSLNRLGELLAAAGVLDWHVRWHGERPRVDAMVIFRKGEPAQAGIR